MVIDESGKDAFVIQSLENYESERCECELCGDGKEQDGIGDLDDGDDAGDAELMRKVNEDIAKWRNEQKSGEAPSVARETKTDKAQSGQGAFLSEEERYYLEPLE